MIRELLPYVDGNFRTLAHRARRGVSGFSMGGFGAFAYATKYPETFSVGIGYDSALDTWETLLGRRAYIAAAAFGNDESSFDRISPWANAARNAAVLIETSRLRGVTGAQYRDFNAAFRDHLAALGIPYDYVETDCAHELRLPDRARRPGQLGPDPGRVQPTCNRQRSRRVTCAVPSLGGRQRRSGTSALGMKRLTRR